MDQWTSGPVDQWTNGPMGAVTEWPGGRMNVGPTPRNIPALSHSAIADIGPSVHWSTGPLIGCCTEKPRGGGGHPGVADPSGAKADGYAKFRTRRSGRRGTRAAAGWWQCAET